MMWFPLHHFAACPLGLHGPDIAVVAPGKPAKMLLKLRFSCIRMTTCWIEWFAGGAVGGVTALVLLHPANATASDSGRARRVFTTAMLDRASEWERSRARASDH